MGIDTTLVSGILSAKSTVGAAFVPKVTEWFSSRDKGRKVPELEQIEALVKESYTKLRPLLTDNCVKILKKVEDEESYLAEQIRQFMYPNLNMSPDDMKIFNREFEYRLQFMQLLGLLTKPSSEYSITNFGASFLVEARRNKHYNNVLSQ